MSRLVPMVVESDGRYERSFDIYSRLLRDRIVFLGTEVDDDVANSISAQLLFLEGEDAEREISLYVNSPGGSAYAGMAIYDTMQYVRPDVRTVCLGMGMSAAAMILCGGAPGNFAERRSTSRSTRRRRCARPAGWPRSSRTIPVTTSSR